jgi:hypothetical protein
MKLKTMKISLFFVIKNSSKNFENYLIVGEVGPVKHFYFWGL